ncbi:Nitrate reductase NADH [Durusdinium trenchii]|uniref:Nitrate reductase NADH n=1 Tax=Durusdinium trenchii TaxID=1381693 RepID=A0ABP0KNV2_9DINO
MAEEGPRRNSLMYPDQHQDLDIAQLLALELDDQFSGATGAEYGMARRVSNSSAGSIVRGHANSLMGGVLVEPQIPVQSPYDSRHPTASDFVPPVQLSQALNALDHGYDEQKGPPPQVPGVRPDDHKWEEIPNPNTMSGDNSSLDVFMSFCKYFQSATNPGEIKVEAEAIISRDCYEMWLKTRQRALKKPEESFRKTVTAHCTGTDGRKPFPVEVERSILVQLRKQMVWPCFQNRLSSRGEKINIGLQGFRGQGYHEEKSQGGDAARPRGKRPQSAKMAPRTGSTRAQQEYQRQTGTQQNGMQEPFGEARMRSNHQPRQSSETHQQHRQRTIKEEASRDSLQQQQRPRPPDSFQQYYGVGPAMTRAAAGHYQVQNRNHAGDQKRKRQQSRAGSSEDHPSTAAASSAERIVATNLAEWRKNPALLLMALQRMRISPSEFMGPSTRDREVDLDNAPLFLGKDVRPTTIRAGGLHMMTRFFKPHHFLSLLSVSSVMNTSGIFDPDVMALSLNIPDRRFSDDFMFPDEGLFDDRPIGRNIFCLNTFIYISSDKTARDILGGTVCGSLPISYTHPLQFWMVAIKIISRLMQRGELVWQGVSKTLGGRTIVTRTRYLIVGETIHTHFQDVSDLNSDILKLEPFEDVARRFAVTEV